MDHKIKVKNNIFSNRDKSIAKNNSIEHIHKKYVSQIEAERKFDLLYNKTEKLLKSIQETSRIYNCNLFEIITVLELFLFLYPVETLKM